MMMTLIMWSQAERWCICMYHYCCALMYAVTKAQNIATHTHAHSRGVNIQALVKTPDAQFQLSDFIVHDMFRTSLLVIHVLLERAPAHILTPASADWYHFHCSHTWSELWTFQGACEHKWRKISGEFRPAEGIREAESFISASFPHLHKK